jgi:hypothetical protein
MWIFIADFLLATFPPLLWQHPEASSAAYCSMPIQNVVGTALSAFKK